MKNMTRAALLGAGSAVALVGLPLMTRFVEAAQHADKADVDTLNAAIELERAGIKAYQDAGATGLLTPAVLEIANRFVSDHAAHRDALIGAVMAGGGTPSSGIVALEYPPLHDQTDILNFAMAVERKAAATYLSVIPDLKDRNLAATAASILGVETTHVALLANALGVGCYKSGFVS